MAFNINSFRGSFTSGEPLSSSSFEFRLVGIPTGLKGKIADSIGRDLTFRCVGASLPGKSLGTTTSKTYGPIRRMAYGSIHEPISCTFILSDSMKEKELFTQWQKYITDDNKGDVKYYDSYVGEAHMVTFDKTANENNLVKYHELYPVDVGEVQMGWDMASQYATITVSFMYRFYEEKSKGSKQSLFNLINSKETIDTTDFDSGSSQQPTLSSVVKNILSKF